MLSMAKRELRQTFFANYHAWRSGALLQPLMQIADLGLHADMLD
jgi:hypothetical protein